MPSKEIKPIIKPAIKKRVEVFTKVSFDKEGRRFNVGDICESTDEEWLMKLTTINALKAKVI